MLAVPVDLCPKPLAALFEMTRFLTCLLQEDFTGKSLENLKALTTLRDALLPKLISGSIRVNNAEFAFKGVE